MPRYRGAAVYLSTSSYGAGLGNVQDNTAYNKSRGMLASTTNNAYGIYDMSRGITEILAGNLTTSSSQATEESQCMTNPAKPPYVNLFRTADGFTKGAAQGAQNGNPLSWSNAQYEYRWNNDVCTWATCGGFGVHETNKYQMLYNMYESWLGGGSSFVFGVLGSYWDARGDLSNGGTIFATGSTSGHTTYQSTRAVLITNV